MDVVRSTGRSLLIIVLLFLFLGLPLQAYSLKIGLAVTEGVFILGGAIFFAHRFYREEWQEALRLRGPGFRGFFTGLAVGVAGWLVATTVEAVIIHFATRLGWHLPPQGLPYPRSTGEVLELFLLVSLGAGVAEELLFRGLVLRGYERLGPGRGVLISALLFSLMHGSFLKLVPVLILGTVYALLALRFNSVFPSMLAHATNNALSLTVLLLQPYFISLPATTEHILGLAVLIVVPAGFALLWTMAKRLLVFVKQGEDEVFSLADTTLGLEFWLVVVLLLVLVALEVFYLLGWEFSVRDFIRALFWRTG